MIKIAIIGGGPAGVSLALQLMQAFKTLTSDAKVQLTLFEKSTEIGFGLPYGLTEDVFSINLPREYMVLMPGEYHHFSTWLTDSEAPFPPRYYFGRYVQDRLLTKQKNSTAQEPTIITRTEHHVIDIQSITDEHYQIYTRHKQKDIVYTANFVILATGHLPSTLLSHLQHHPNYQANPWDMQAYQAINPNHHVAIIGSHLTAIDVALKLENQNHQGKISMFSRSGLLSAVRGPLLSHEIQHLTQKNIRNLLKQGDSSTLLHQLMCLFEKEITPYLPPDLGLWNTVAGIKKSPSFQRLNREIRQAELAKTHWQGVLSYFYQILFKIWPRLHPHEQSHFLNTRLSVMVSFLCSFPLNHAYTIQSMMRKKRLSIHGGLIDIMPDKKHVVIQFEQEKYLKVDYLIHATGSGNDPETIPLLAKMLLSKLIKKHALGGICISTHTYQSFSDQVETPQRLYALGDLVKGACLRTIELGQIVEQARIITQHIINQIGVTPHSKH